MSFDRTRLPDSAGYFEADGLRLTGRGKWRTTSCVFHGGSDSMRINTASGGWCCMACGASGGDVLAYQMAAHGESFIDAAEALGAWIDDGRPAPARATPLPARDAITLVARESNLIAIAGANLANGVGLTPRDLARVLTAAGRIQRIAEAFT